MKRLLGTFLLLFSLFQLSACNVTPTQSSHSQAAEPEEAIQLIELAAKFTSGTGVEKNTDRAIELLSHAAQLGSKTAYCELGNIFLYDSEYIDYLAAEELLLKGVEGNLQDCLFDLGYLFDEVYEEYSDAAYWYQKAIDAGSVAAINNLALLYRDGLGVAQDYAKALELLQDAYRQGDISATVNLGHTYRRGLGIKQSYTKARQYFEAAAEKGNPSAINHLGIIYKNGLGVDVDFDKSLSYYRTAARLGEPYAMYNIANAYRDGRGVQKDLDSAIRWYQLSYSGGINEAIREIAEVYEGLDDSAKALEYYEFCYQLEVDDCQFDYADLLLEHAQQTDLGLKIMHDAVLNEPDNYDSPLRLAQIYDFGLYNVAVDYAQAETFYTIAMERGSGLAYANVGYWYEAGKIRPRDLARASRLYHKAAELGNPQGLNNLGTFYLNGTIVEKDVQKGLELYHRAAELGNDYAQNNLGEIYLEGNLVKQDIPKAVTFFLKAAAQGFEDALVSLGLIYADGESGIPSKLLALQYFNQLLELNPSLAEYYIGDTHYQFAEDLDDVFLSLEHLKRSHQLGDPDAASYIGAIYYETPDLDRNFWNAHQWFEVAAKSGELYNLVYSAAILWNGWQVPEDKALAMDRLQKYAEREQENLNSILGDFFYFGDYLGQDFKLAEKYLLKTIDEINDPVAMNHLGSIYNTGEIDEPNYELSYHYFTRSAELGYAFGIFNLGLAYKHGHGPSVDEGKTYQLMQQAVKQRPDVKRFQCELALLYLDGFGVQQDVDKALEILRLLNAQGHTQSTFELGKYLHETANSDNQREEALKLLELAAEREYDAAREYLNNI